MHELSFGNRLRQDHDNARRINALVETIDDLAGLVSPDALDERPHARLDEARRYKVIDAIVNIDMQGPAATLTPAAQNPADDKDGMRDFSPETVRRRRRDGFKFAHDILRPAFENRWARGIATRKLTAAAQTARRRRAIRRPHSSIIAQRGAYSASVARGQLGHAVN